MIPGIAWTPLLDRVRDLKLPMPPEAKFESSPTMQNDPDPHSAQLPLSRPLAVAAVPPEGLDIVIRPNEHECAALARQNDVRALTDLEARLHVSRSGREGLEVSGNLRGKVRQTCVVTLEDFNSLMDEAVHQRFAPERSPAAPAHPRKGFETSRERRQSVREAAWNKKRAEPEEEPAQHQIIDLDVDAPDPIIGEIIDLGATVSEFLTLSLDPYPRRPGAVFTEPAAPDDEPSPFAVLRQIGPKSGEP